MYKDKRASLSELFFQLKGWFALGPLWSHQSYNQWYLLVRILSQCLAVDLSAFGDHWGFRFWFLTSVAPALISSKAH